MENTGDMENMELTCSSRSSFIQEHREITEEQWKQLKTWRHGEHGAQFLHTSRRSYNATH